MAFSEDYFESLRRGEKLESLDLLKAQIHELEHSPIAPSVLVGQFWNASRACSFNPTVNSFALHRNTRLANAVLAKKMSILNSSLYGQPDQWTTDDMEVALTVYERLQTIPPKEFIDIWVQSTIGHMQGKTSKWLLNAVENLSRLGVYPGDEWITDWWNAAKPISGEWKLEGGYSALYRLAILDFIRFEQQEGEKDECSPCREIADSFMGFIEKNAPHLYAKHIDSRVYFSAVWFGYDFVSDYKIEPEKGKASALEKKFYGAVQRMGIDVFEQGLIVSGIEHKVDLELKLGEKSFGIEVDGVLHFNRSAQHGRGSNAIEYNSSTRFQCQLIRRLMPDIDVLRVPYFLIDGNLSELPLEKTLNKIARKSESDVYAWHGGSIARPVKDKNGFIFNGYDL